VNFINTYKVNNFKEHKKNLIDLIFKIPQTIRVSSDEKIFHTDWAIPNTMRREYKEYFEKNILKDFLNNFLIKNKFNEVEIDNIWFQVYNTGDFHKFHTHAKANFTNVFYLQLPTSCVKTNIVDVDLEIEEGDILTFPAFMKHESPINKFKEFKIIISFNTNVLK
jgi:uncharacterized protein YjlB|tara:strand:+ start:61 stop:555 length:495 start_codon:yes stop_codon:yes gene_type:complete